jgi:hypothetical protein
MALKKGTLVRVKTKKLLLKADLKEAFGNLNDNTVMNCISSQMMGYLGKTYLVSKGLSNGFYLNGAGSYIFYEHWVDVIDTKAAKLLYEDKNG